MSLTISGGFRANRQRILPNFAFYKPLFLYFLCIILKQIH